MQKDIRHTALYREADALFRTVHQPGTGQISDAAELNVAPDGKHAVFSGTFLDNLEGAQSTRICQVDLLSGDIRVMTFGPNTDRLAKYSPDGRQIAFLSDRRQVGDYQLYLLDPGSGAARSAAIVEGWVNTFTGRRTAQAYCSEWPATAQKTLAPGGAVNSRQVAEAVPSWMPSIETGDESYHWRRAFVYDLATGLVRRVSSADANIWEAVWCGTKAVAAVVSPGPGEGLWYSARLALFDIETGNSREIHKPRDQLGSPAASPSGRHLAIVEAVASDRWLVVGDLQLIDTGSGSIRRVDTRGVDISYAEWRSDRQLLLAGHRGFDSVVGSYDVVAGAFTEVWCSREVTAGACT